MSSLSFVLNRFHEITGCKPRQSGDQFMCKCPAHDDGTPSLSVTEMPTGQVLLHCHAGCSFHEVLDATKLTTTDLIPSYTVGSSNTFTNDPFFLESHSHNTASSKGEGFKTPEDAIAAYERNPKLGKHTTKWEYYDADGSLVGVILRWDKSGGKEIRPISLIDGYWQMTQMPESRPLYRRNEVQQADLSQLVFVVEGEKSADAAQSIGLLATTSAGGSKAAGKTDWSPLAGRSVVLIPDNDRSGDGYSQTVAVTLAALNPPAIVRRINLIDDWPQLPPAGDIADWCNSHDATEPATLKARIEALVDKAEFLAAAVAPVSVTGVKDVNYRSQSASDAWPESLDRAAYWGLSGEIVRRIEPHSEADPAALLISLLVAFGNVIGRTAHFQAEGARHYLNLFAVLVGQTSKGRKGSSWSQVSRLCGKFDEEWAKNRIVKGLSSGEGFIHAVRDPVEQQQPIKQGGRVVGYETVIVDPGVADKRLMVIEEEFAGVLAMTAREGNILSPRLREAWDTGDLRTMTKNPVTATGGHVSILSHTTRDELRRSLNSTEQSNGFGNRFLWLCVRRSKCLPDGGRIHEVDFSDLVKQLGDARHFATSVDVFERDHDAREYWHDIYPDLSEGKPGLTGAMLGRAEAQVMRLACIYASLDRSYLVRLEHLQAALALWAYCEASTRHIFGNSLGNKDADEINAHLLAAYPHGLTRTEINNCVFNRNKRATEIDAALRVLLENHLARFQVEQTEGRDCERWFAVVGTK